jgi:transposase-like protein
MLNELEQKILNAYQDGSDLNYIIQQFNTTHQNVKNILINLKENSRFKRTFTDEFKVMIAERDVNGVARRQIAQELEINVNTVKKACEQFGQAFKDKASSENEYTRIDGDFNMSKCPSCKSSKVNEVEEDTTYCKNCGSEHIIKKDHALKINWEFLEE